MGQPVLRRRRRGRLVLILLVLILPCLIWILRVFDPHFRNPIGLRFWEYLLSLINLQPFLLLS